MFLKLPDDVIFGLSVQERKEFLNNHQKKIQKHSYIETLDVKNGYIKIFFDQEGIITMCYWNLKDGRKLIALDNFNEFDCKPPKIFFYKDGELTPDDDY